MVVVEAAMQLLMSIGMKRSEAIRALLPMTRQVLENFERLGPRAAWTGPLARGDYGVVAAHVEALQQFSPEYRDAYDALNRLAMRVLTPEAPPNSSGSGKEAESPKARAKSTGGRG